jgi:hypothetical protein
MTIDSSKRDPKNVRIRAAELSTANGFESHQSNRDKTPPYIFNFTKGVEHGLNGLLVNPAEFDDFAVGTEHHEPLYFEKADLYHGPFRTETINGHPETKVYRQWESPTAGHAYVLEGPDPHAVTMPPAPEAGSAEFAAEMAELYQMALSRDWPFAAFMDASLVNAMKNLNGSPVSVGCLSRIQASHADVVGAAARLSKMRWFQGETGMNDATDMMLRKRRRWNEPQTAQNLFRGAGEDGWETPFLSQFMVMGTGAPMKPPAEHDAERASGLIKFGAQTIDQRVTVAIPEKDYMTDWENWLDVQNGLGKRYFVRDVQDKESVKGARRIMARLRDLATYVHDDALYQAYLNAALILLGEGFALDPGIPYHNNTQNPNRGLNREPFALFGGPHLLTLVTEVSSRALKAVRLQKFSVHRRLRPEAAGALFHTVFTGYHPHRATVNTSPYAQGDGSAEAEAVRQLAAKIAPYTHPYDQNGKPTGSEKDALDDILTDIRNHNQKVNQTEGQLNNATWLLPMAFPEGSPMHPSYGAGHATVAGACVTLLKAFFAMSDPKTPAQPVYLVKPGQRALVPDGGVKATDPTIDLLGIDIPEGLTLEGELNKLMWNISNGRNIAGVHYYSDYIESALLGEAITIGILREQMLAYHPDEKVEMTVPLLVSRTLPKALLSGSTLSETDVVAAVKILSTGALEKADPTMGRA